jgi:putative transposase
MALINEARKAGARLSAAVSCVGLSVRTYQRWQAQDGGDDERRGPRTRPANRLSDGERQRVLEISNRPEFRDLPPCQIVPRLAERGEYVASESTFYRVLRENEQLKHRNKARPASQHHPREHVASGPRQVWSWDITYLRTDVRGLFFYLYVIVDLWSRKIVGWEVADCESTAIAAELVTLACNTEAVVPGTVVLHQDNGSPMKGATLLCTLQKLGVAASFSRPGVSNDNPFSEALFRTLKYRPEYPSKPFGCLSEARQWVAAFVDWYNNRHLHSALNWVTPAARHDGRDIPILEQREQVYELAKQRHPERWSGAIRNCEPAGDVYLNPERVSVVAQRAAA